MSFAPVNDCPSSAEAGRRAAEERELRVRIHAAENVPTVIYLPGLHGDWTLNAGFRRAIGQRAQLIEVTYPRTLTWSLDDYAAGIETALAERGIATGWLLGESFGSQVVWSLLARGRFQTQGVIFAGGFGEYPVKWGVRLVRWLIRRLPLGVMTRFAAFYSAVARWRFRQVPDSADSIREFVERRTELDRQAMVHRLQLIAAHDPSATASQLQLPVFLLSGLVDPVVPWPLTRRWFRRHCPSLRGFRVISLADHNVLNTAPAASARAVLGWIQSCRRDTNGGTQIHSRHH